MISNIKLCLESGLKIPFNFDINSSNRRVLFNSEAERYAYKIEKKLGVEWTFNNEKVFISNMNKNKRLTFCPTVGHDSMLIYNIKNDRNLSLYNATGEKLYTVPNNFVKKDWHFNSPYRYTKKDGTVGIAVWLLHDYIDKLELYPLELPTGKLGEIIKKSRM